MDSRQSDNGSHGGDRYDSHAPRCCARAAARRSEAICFVVPPYVVADVGDRGGFRERDAASRTLAASAAIRARRDVTAHLLRELNLRIADLAFLAPPRGERWTVYDGERGSSLPGRRMRGEGDPASPDAAVDEAYNGAVLTYSFYKNVFERDSIDDQGIELVSSVHYGQEFDNTLWNGTQMIYSDGSGVIIAKGTLTKAVDVIGHELTHGITQMTAGLEYRKQSGALNESFSDVFGSLVKQYSRGETAEDADWLIGDGILGTAVPGRALRSMKDPGHAFDLDRQAGHMSAYVDLPADNNPRNDNGGVHINESVHNPRGRAHGPRSHDVGGRRVARPGRRPAAAGKGRASRPVQSAGAGRPGSNVSGRIRLYGHR